MTDNMQIIGQKECENKSRYLRVLPFVLRTKIFPSLISSRNGYLTKWWDR